MKGLLILRHAKSSWDNAHLADHDRPLNDRGKGDAPRMGRLLLREDLVPDLIVSSSAERAYATAEAVALACDFDGDLRVSRDLYMADPEDFLAFLNGLNDSFRLVMVVGHNPGVAELVELLTGVQDRMPTAALAYVELPIDNWTALTDEVEGALVDLWWPKQSKD
jgi:phosphohistidine phosphatase